jgi:acetyltransferase-like isoleucine patch superfamily enzyme
VNYNSFLNLDEISKMRFGYVGKNVKISRNAQFYGAEFLSIQDNTRIDDFAIISTQSESFIGKNVHIGNRTYITSSLGFFLGDYSGVSSNCSLFGDSDDFSGEFMSNPTFEMEKRNVTSNQLIIQEFAVIGVSSIMLPGASLNEGSVLGAFSCLKKATEPWTVYIGNPARAINNRKDQIKKFVIDL